VKENSLLLFNELSMVINIFKILLSLGCLMSLFILNANTNHLLNTIWNMTLIILVTFSSIRLYSSYALFDKYPCCPILDCYVICFYYEPNTPFYLRLCPVMLIILLYWFVELNILFYSFARYFSMSMYFWRTVPFWIKCFKRICLIRMKDDIL